MTAVRASVEWDAGERDELPEQLPVFGTLPDRERAEAVVRARINSAVPRLRDGTDWSQDFELRVIHRRESSASRRPYRLRQWGVWVTGRPLPVGYVTEMRAPGLPANTRLIFIPLALSERDFVPGQ